MLSVRKRSWLPANLLLVLFLAGAQSGALAHAFEHDAGTPQYQACAICVTVGQLHTSSVDALAATMITDSRGCQPVAETVSMESLQAPVAKQRGPPKAL
jgi:hypothetical protein